jgi:dTDP-4-amino-4,6-dideoxygalactose transaminase
MKKSKYTRRKFITTAAAGSVAAVASPSLPGMIISRQTTGLAALGGNPIRSKDKPWPSWPYVDDKIVDAVSKTARSRIWCRIDSPKNSVSEFEKLFASLIGTGFSVATGSGTQALHTSVEALGIGPGDEVITSPFTDPGTISSIISARALPVMADLESEYFQLDPREVEKKITENTKAIMPVHMGGQPCNMDAILSIAKKHNLRVIEDAAQSHLGAYKGRKMGTMGDLGCFSFQSSKTMACGEGGAITGNDEKLMDQCYTVMNHGTNRQGRTSAIGPKYRMNEFEASVLLAQAEGVKARFETRNRNSAHLSSRLKNFPGVIPQKLYPGTDSGSFYLYMMTYKKEHFNNADRALFLKAMNAEGIPLTAYIRNGLNKEPWVQNILGQKVYQKMYSPERLRTYAANLNCPVCEKAIGDVLLIWASGPLLGTIGDMDNVADAILKVYENRDKLSSIS